VKTRLIRPAAIVLLVLAVTLPIIADSAKSLYNKGKDAEARQNYEAAFDFYKQAYEQKPKDLAYRASYERTRFLAGASHVHRGQLLREAGKLQEALAEFQKGAEIDSASFIAQQEIRRTQKLIIDAGNAPGPTTVEQPPTGLQKRVQEAQGPVDLAAISNVPITLKLTEDTKVIYETVGKLAGINVLFDPDYTSRRVKIELNGVTLQEALEIIALESKTFWRPVTPNTIFVASDNPAKRKEVEQSVIRRSIWRTFRSPRNCRMWSTRCGKSWKSPAFSPCLPRARWWCAELPIRLRWRRKLVGDLDKARPEVIVEVAVMQVSRDKTRNLGISPPTSATVALQNNVNTTTSTGTSTSTTGTSTSTSGTANQVNLNRLGNLNATDFTVTIPAATATALFGDSNTKIIQNPQIRAVDGQKASLKIGDRIPIATGSFQPGIGGVGINPLVNTQFQYTDVGVNIDITPKVHAGREVTLKIVMDISSVTSQSNIGGISQPIIGQRKIEHEIRLKEGEVNILGGMLEDRDIRSLNGIPGLSSIPILKYLFSQTNTEHATNEIVFAMIPHIVRSRDVTDLNERALEVGTASSIELRRTSQAPPPPVPTNEAAPAAAQAPMPTPPTQPALQTAAGAASFVFDPASLTQAQGSTFAVNVLLRGAQNVYSVPCR